MAVQRFFYPSDDMEKIVLRSVLPGELDTFRDFSTSSLGRIVMTECDVTDNGGVISLFDSETVAVEAKHLVVPVIELAQEEAMITLGEGDECEIKMLAAGYGSGVMLFRHDPNPKVKFL